MLTINSKPVPVDIGPPVSPLPFARHRRLREVDCLNGTGGDYRADGNGMYDQRVRRGSNFVRPKRQPPAPQPSLAARRKFCEARNRLLEKKRLQREALAQGTRKHVNVQCDRVSPEELETWPLISHGATQTDFYPCQLQQQDQRTLGEIVLCKTGVDATTQVTVRDLIDFETEAFPVTEMLVSRVLERAAVCVLYEDDAAALRREQAVYEKRRRAEIVEISRLEHDEAIHRKQGLCELKRAERARPEPTYRALHGRALAHQYMAGLRDDALGQLVATGYLRGDDYQLDSWLRGRVRGQPRREANADAYLNSLICNAIVKRAGASPRPSSTAEADENVTPE